MGSKKSIEERIEEIGKNNLMKEKLCISQKRKI